MVPGAGLRSDIEPVEESQRRVIEGRQPAEAVESEGLHGAISSQKEARSDRSLLEGSR
jgi:hypothetical protein